MQSIENRIQKFNRILSATSSIRKFQGKGNCLSGKDKDSLSNYLNVGKRLGGDSKFGEAYRASVKGVPNSELAIKVVPVAKKANQIDWTIKEVFKEIRVLDKLGGLVEDYITPNVPLAYDMFICLECKYSNPSLINRKAPNSCAIVLNELASGDLDAWMKSKHTKEQWKSAIFQVLAGLTAVEEYMGMFHDDLHGGNMLFTDVKSGGCWHYRFITPHKTYNFYPPNTGQLWKLWDFGFARQLKKNRGAFRKMAEDIARGIYEFMIQPLPKHDIAKGLKDSTLSINEKWQVVDAIQYSIQQTYHRGPAYVPAFAVLKFLGWFTKPCGRILNSIPYTSQLREY